MRKPEIKNYGELEKMLVVGIAHFGYINQNELLRYAREENGININVYSSFLTAELDFQVFNDEFNNFCTEDIDRLKRFEEEIEEEERSRFLDYLNNSRAFDYNLFYFEFLTKGIDFINYKYSHYDVENLIKNYEEGLFLGNLTTFKNVRNKELELELF